MKVKLHGGPMHGRELDLPDDLYRQGWLRVATLTNVDKFPELQQLAERFEETGEPAEITVEADIEQSTYTRVGSSKDFEWVGTL